MNLNQWPIRPTSDLTPFTFSIGTKLESGLWGKPTDTQHEIELLPPVRLPHSYGPQDRCNGPISFVRVSFENIVTDLFYQTMSSDKLSTQQSACQNTPESMVQKNMKQSIALLRLKYFRSFLWVGRRTK